MFFGKFDEEFIDSLPDFLGDKIDLFGQTIVILGNIITIIGITLEATEVEVIEEEEVAIEGGDASNSSEADSAASESNIGFILSLLGASLITIGDTVSAGGISLEIQQHALNEKKTKQHNEEQELRFRDLENRVEYMQRNMNSLILKTEALQNEVIFLRQTLYPHLY